MEMLVAGYTVIVLFVVLAVLVMICIAEDEFVLMVTGFLVTISLGALAIYAPWAIVWMQLVAPVG